jgi:fatty-acyl-CoA synthase
MTPEERERLEAYEDALAHDLLRATQISMWEMLRRSASRYPELAAIRTENEIVTYHELVERSLRCAARLEDLGIGRGSRVSLMFHNCVEWAVAHYATLRLGAVVVPVNLAYEADEMRWVFERGQTEIILAPTGALGLDFAGKLTKVDPRLVHGPVELPELPALRRVHLLPTEAEYVLPETEAYCELFGRPGDRLLREPGPTTGHDPAYVLFTSGSTAHPKPALCRGGAYVGAAVALARSLDFEAGDGYPGYNPTFHSSGVIWTLTLPHAVGGHPYLIPKFDGKQVLDAIRERKVTHAGAFDTMFTMMMAVAGGPETDMSHLKGWSVGCTPSFLRRVMETWTINNYVHIYGSTESTGLCTVTPFACEDGEARMMANGRPAPGIDVRIIDPETGEACAPNVPGEICFRGWCLFIEYLDMPEEMETAFDEDGFFHSGDYGWLDEDGFLYFRGRYKMMIKTGGENVAQREVEIFLEDTLPFLKHAEVVGVPDDTWGEAVLAFVEYGDGVERDREQLRALCKGKIANFKIPQYFVTIEPGQWPMLGSGRVDKPALQRRALEEVGTAES